MKKCTTIILAACLISIIYSCNSAEASKAKKEISGDDYFKSLKDLGFTNSPSVTKPTNDYWRKIFKAKYGLSFIGDDEMTELNLQNHMIFSPASNYKGAIPDYAAKEIVKNYKLVPDGKHYWYDAVMERWMLVGTNEYGMLSDKGNKGVFVVAHPDMFEDSAYFKHKDPIAVLKVEGGWLEIARWK